MLVQVCQVLSGWLDHVLCLCFSSSKDASDNQHPRPSKEGGSQSPSSSWRPYVYTAIFSPAAWAPGAQVNCPGLWDSVPQVLYCSVDIPEAMAVGGRDQMLTVQGWFETSKNSSTNKYPGFQVECWKLSGWFRSTSPIDFQSNLWA